MRFSVLFFAFFTLFSPFSVAQKPTLPGSVVPQGLGYNIHFTYAKPGELQMLKDSGGSIIRMDFSWGATEKEKGIYDFSAFEHLTGELEKYGIRPLYILDYSNRHYDEGLSPYSEQGRKAFAKWAAAAAMHFKDRGILWEMYNEPNISFWKPKPNPEHYILLALEVGKALREAAPNELYIGPATSEIDLDFLEKCFRGGLLEYWDAVSVHPYRQKSPETVVEEYAKLRHLIEKYAPEGKEIPILSAEWGYSSAWNRFNDEIQGKMLPREWMINLACGIPISIWYDWKDDGKDPEEPEHHFGTVNHDHHKDRDPVYDPKPAYIAARTFTETFRGFRYNKSIHVAKDHHLLLFENEDRSEVRFAIWTPSERPQKSRIPCSPGAKFRVISHLGDDLGILQAPKDGDGLSLEISDAPLYLVPKKTDSTLRKIAEFPALPRVHYLSNANLHKIDVLPREYRLPESYTRAEGFRSSSPSTFIAQTEVEGIVFQQEMFVYSTNPLIVHSILEPEQKLRVRVENPGGMPYRGELVFNDSPEGENERKIPLVFEKNQRTFEHQFSVNPFEKGKFHIGISITDVESSEKIMTLLDDFSQYDPGTFAQSWSVHAEGDSQVGSEQSLRLSEGEAEITYQFDEGWKYICFSPKKESFRTIAGKPDSLSLRIQSDGSGNSVRMRFLDREGQTFQSTAGKLSEKGPQHFTFKLVQEGLSHWGGPGDGIIRFPIRFDCIIIDGTRTSLGPNTISLSQPVWVYKREEDFQ